MGAWLKGLPQAEAVVVAAFVGAIVSLVTLFVSPLIQRALERVKGGVLRDVERTKAELANKASAENARRTYEFDARKRLYDQIEPLLFQLFEAAEGSYYRVASLVRTQKQKHLGSGEESWLHANKQYYFNSTIYRLFLPLAIYRLIQRSATFVDLNLDHRIRTKYSLLKLSYYAFTDDHVLADTAPKLTYEPNVADWQHERERNPAFYWRQGLTIGALDHLIDSMIVPEGEGHRPMNYGEFEGRALSDAAFQSALAPVGDIFIGFSFDRRPVLARILLAHAYLMRLLLHSYEAPTEVHQLGGTLHAFAASGEAETDLTWWHKHDPRDLVVGYLEDRLLGQAPNAYAITAGGR